MQHEKKKMTRKEAIACLQKHVMPIHNADQLVDFYIEAGMLEIVEDKPEDTYVLVKDIDGDTQRVAISNIKTSLASMGYKLIKIDD